MTLDDRAALQTWQGSQPTTRCIARLIAEEDWDQGEGRGPGWRWSSQGASEEDSGEYVVSAICNPPELGTGVDEILAVRSDDKRSRGVEDDMRKVIITCAITADGLIEAPVPAPDGWLILESGQEQPAFEMFHNVQRLKSDLNGDLITSGAGCLRRAS